MNAQQGRTFNDEVAEYDRLDNIAFSELMRACRQNVKVKNLSETGEFNTVYELLQRLRQRYYTVHPGQREEANQGPRVLPPCEDAHETGLANQ